MKIAILLETNFSAGGAFSYSFDTCLDLLKNSKKNNLQLYCLHKNTIELFKKKGIKAELLIFSFYEKNIIRLINFRLFRFLIKISPFIVPIEKKLLKKNIDAIFFPTLSKSIFLFKKIKFYSSVLDLCHIYHNRNFPEINEAEFNLREDMYNYSLRRSIKILTNSDEIKYQISKRYKVRKENILTIPFLPKKLNKKIIRKNFLKKKYNRYKNFIVYPAQIWSHKNHKAIIEACKILKKTKVQLNFLFCGRDKGQKDYLIDLINLYELKNIHFLNFISENEINYLYRKCKGVIMTSYFGPTNLPPLEAWSYNKPIIYNKNFQKELGRNTCEFVNVDNYKELSISIKKIADNKYSKIKLINANNSLQKMKKNYKKKIKLLVEFFETNINSLI